MQETMTSRERIVRTLNHEPVDRLPIDLGSHMSTGISAFAYWNLRKHLGLSTDEIWIPDLVQFLAYVNEDVLQRFHCDCILLEPRWREERTWNPRGDYRFAVPRGFVPEYVENQGWIARQGTQTMRMPENGFFFDGGWLSSGWEGLTEDEVIRAYAKEAARIYNETEYATNFVGYSHGHGFSGYFDGMDHAVAMTLNPDEERKRLEARCDRQIEHFKKINKAFGNYLQLLTISNDMGMQTGPLANPEVINDVCGPAFARFCQYVHDHSDIKVFMHNCGSIRSIMPYICEWGVDAINPVQIASAGMDPQELVDEFGDKIVFWGGGCCTQTVLAGSTPDEVAAHVRENVRIFSQKNGFVFNQVHNIMGDVPPENIVAMFDAAYDEGVGKA